MPAGDRQRDPQGARARPRCRCDATRAAPGAGDGAGRRLDRGGHLDSSGLASGMVSQEQMPAPSDCSGPGPADRDSLARGERPPPDGAPSGDSFNLAEVAGGAIDEAQERWLIQKDKPDFGPFSLAQIRAQIERGEIVGEHAISSTATPARARRSRTSPGWVELLAALRAPHRADASGARGDQPRGKEKAKSAFTMVVVRRARRRGRRLLRLVAQGGRPNPRSRSRGTGRDRLVPQVGQAELRDREGGQAGSGGGHTAAPAARRTTPTSATIRTSATPAKRRGGDEVLDDQLIEER